MYRTVVTDYNPSAEAAAKEMQELIKKMNCEGFELISSVVTTSEKNLLVFRHVTEHEK